MSDQKQKTIRLVQLGEVRFRDAWEVQKKAVELRLSDREQPDRLFIVEHPAVFTLGRRGGREFLTVSDNFLASHNVEVIRSDRGGLITYHGPGQIVAYPVIDLQGFGMGVSQFVDALEEVIVNTLACLGINASGDPVNRGVWVSGKKIASIGVTVKKGVTSHGLALNVSCDLTPFGWMTPCGLSGVSMTRVTEMAAKETVDTVVPVLIQSFESVFGVAAIS